MSEISVERGLCLGFGGTNARVGVYEEGAIVSFNSAPTPEDPEEFFKWMARQTLESAENGSEWAVAGFPGPVSTEGKLVGPMANVRGMSEKQYDLATELEKADPSTARLFEEGFNLIAVNDGELAAHAAALKMGEGKYAKVAALILGTGVGSGIVERDNTIADIYRTDRSNPAEIGHILIGDDADDTYENTASGTALEKRYGIEPKDIPPDHRAWKLVGKMIGRMATTLSQMHGAELVVTTGGVGANNSDKYNPHLDEFMRRYDKLANGTQKTFRPDIKPVSPRDAQIFELYGAEGIMKDFMTRPDAQS